MKAHSFSPWAQPRTLVPLLVILACTSACVSPRPAEPEPVSIQEPPAHLNTGSPAMFVEWNRVGGQWEQAAGPLGVGLAARRQDPRKLVELWMMERVVEPAQLSSDRVVVLGPRENLQQRPQLAEGILGSAEVYPPGEVPSWPLELDDLHDSNSAVHPLLFPGDDLRVASSAEQGAGLAKLVAWNPGSTEIDVGTLRVTVPQQGEPEPTSAAIAYVHVSTPGNSDLRLEVWVLGGAYTADPPPGTKERPRSVVLGPLSSTEQGELYSGPDAPTAEEFHVKAVAWLGGEPITTVLVVTRTL